MSNWQGGIRVNAYAAGGYLPASLAGSVNSNLMAGCDVYATFCAIAGVDPTDERAAAAGLPPVDGVNQWPSISGAQSGPIRKEVPVGSAAGEANFPRSANNTVVQGIVTSDGWKLMVGSTGQNIWTGVYYPNQTTSWKDIPYDCGFPGKAPPANKTASGCLFNITADPTEHFDVADQFPDVVTELYARINAWQETAFSPDRGSTDPAACEAAVTRWGGFWGPFIA